MTEPNTKKTREVVFPCRNCGNRTSHLLIHFHSVDIPFKTGGADAMHPGEIILSDYYILFECKTCRGMSLKNVFEADMDYGEDIQYDRIKYLYPPAKDLDKDIPDGINLIIEEANKVKQISSLAYVILIRKVLEEVCKERGIREKNLEKKLEKLVESESLPTIFIEATSKLRLLGNIGAHASKIDITGDDATLIEEFILALVEHIYVLPSKVKKLGETLLRQKEKIQP